MGQDFIRCFIGDISINTLRGVQRGSGKFDDWQLMDGSQFEYKNSYGYKPVFARDEVLIEALAKRSVVAENRQPQKVAPSLMWNNALLIADVLTLLSLARARYYPTLLIERRLGKKHSIGWGIMSPETAGSWDIVSFSKFGHFISEALTFIEQNPSWLKDSGFIPSIYWYTQALQTRGTGPSILEMALYWVSLEILASTYVEENALNIEYKKERVKRFITDKGYSGNEWNFLDGIIDDWYKVRNNAFHEGKEPLLSMDARKVRRQQVRDFTSLVLVEMLQPQGDKRRLEITEQMRRYDIS